MIVLVLNAGSSSLRFQLLSAEADLGRFTRLGGGAIESIGIAPRAWIGSGGRDVPWTDISARTHAAATDLALEWLRAIEAGRCCGTRQLDVVGVRVVYAGSASRDPELVSGDLLDRLEEFDRIAPLHNRAAIETIRRVRLDLGPDLPVVAVFDSAFHSTLPAVARTCAIPFDLAARHGIQRVGFHGIAVASVVERFTESFPDTGSRGRIAALHLGGGCSVTAVRDGRSVECSMGFSPLEGLVMPTRSGDLDPALVPYLARVEGVGAEEIVRRLNRASGLLGVSGRTGDMREIVRLRNEGDPRASLAFDLFAYRAKQHLAASAAALGGLDAVLFSGGIGENAPAVREAICSGMEWCGIHLDPDLNADVVGSEGTISSRRSVVGVQVVPADEERVIAREASACLKRLLTGNVA